MSDRILTFEIIKYLWATVSIRKKSRASFKELAQNLKVEEHEITGEIRVLKNLDIVHQMYFPESNMRTAELLPKAFTAFDKTPNPKNWEEFEKRFNYPEKDFGESIVIQTPKEPYWTKKRIEKYGFGIGIPIVVAIILSLLGL